MLVVLALIVIVGLVLAEVYGTDSRDGRDWTDRSEPWPSSDRDIVSSRF